jgi:hypothetical protein
LTTARFTGTTYQKIILLPLLHRPTLLRSLGGVASDKGKVFSIFDANPSCSSYEGKLRQVGTVSKRVLAALWVKLVSKCYEQE